MLQNVLEDPRIYDLVVYTFGWIILWTMCLNLAPSGGEKSRNHVIVLNALHGLISTFFSICTISFGWPTTNSVAISLGYFLVDMFAMLYADGLCNFRRLHKSRIMDYIHHIFGIFWGAVFFYIEETVCDASLGNPYVWIQTNEISTPFYNWYRLSQSKIAGGVFAMTFFLSRILFNTFFMIPQIVWNCNTNYLWACLPFFGLQYVWFYMIVMKLLRVIRPNITPSDAKITSMEEVKKTSVISAPTASYDNVMAPAVSSSCTNTSKKNL